MTTQATSGSAALGSAASFSAEEVEASRTGQLKLQILQAQRRPLHIDLHFSDQKLSFGSRRSRSLHVHVMQIPKARSQRPDQEGDPG